MTIITIGPGATDRANSDSSATYTEIDINNSASASGYLNVMELWYNTNATGVKFGTFLASSVNSYDDRDYETLGSVASGSKKTFTGLNCDVVVGDWPGVYSATGKIELDDSGSGYKYKSGDWFGQAVQIYSTNAEETLSMHATGLSYKIYNVAPAKIYGVVPAKVFGV